jgi:hypothetical protein
MQDVNLGFNWQKQQSKGKDSFYQQIGIKFKEESSEFYFRGTDLCGAENWTFRKGDQKYLEGFQMWCWRRIEKIIQTDRVRN